jgi:hypothetical protein
MLSYFPFAFSPAPADTDVRAAFSRSLGARNSDRGAGGTQEMAASVYYVGGRLEASQSCQLLQKLLVDEVHDGLGFRSGAAGDSAADVALAQRRPAEIAHVP